MLAPFCFFPFCFVIIFLNGRFRVFRQGIDRPCSAAMVCAHAQYDFSGLGGFWPSKVRCVVNQWLEPLLDASSHTALHQGSAPVARNHTLSGRLAKEAFRSGALFYLGLSRCRRNLLRDPLLPWPYAKPPVFKERWCDSFIAPGQQFNCPSTIRTNMRQRRYFGEKLKGEIFVSPL